MPFYKFPSLKHPRAIYPARRNFASPQSRGLTGWWPLHAGGGSETVQSHTRDTKTRFYSALRPGPAVASGGEDLLDFALDTDDNFRPHIVADSELGSALRITANFTRASMQLSWNMYIAASVGCVSAWINPREAAKSTTLGNLFTSVNGFPHDKDQGYFGLVYSNHNGGGNQVHGFNFDGNEDFVSFSISLNTWYHVFLRHAGGNLYLYVNGVQRATVASGDTQLLTGTPRIGDYGGAPAAMDVADIRTYNQDVPPEVIYQMWHPATRWELYARTEPEFYFVPAAAVGERRWLFGARQ